MKNVTNLDKLLGEVSKKLGPYLKKMVELHSSDLLSVFLYGSATGVNYVPGISDINLVIVLRRLDFDFLSKSLKLVSSGIRQKITAPLFLTPEYIRSSLDVFPMEFLDMKENNVLLYGEDLLADIDIKAEHLRLFCEQQLKGKLVRIRQAYLEIGLKRKGIESLLKESLNSLIPVFRSLIRLRGETPAINKAELLGQLSEDFELAQDVFLSIYRDSANDEKIAGQDVVVFLGKYISEIQTLSEKVDRL